MYIYRLPKINKESSNKRTISNWICHHYESAEEAYKDSHSITEAPKCINCGKPAKLISFFKGYRKNCGCTACVEAIRDKSFLSNIRSVDEDFLAHVSENIKEYNKIFNGESLYLEYYDRWFDTKSSMKRFVLTKVGGKSQFDREVKCRACGNHDVTINLLSDDISDKNFAVCGKCAKAITKYGLTHAGIKNHNNIFKIFRERNFDNIVDKFIFYSSLLDNPYKHISTNSIMNEDREFLLLYNRFLSGTVYANIKTDVVYSMFSSSSKNRNDDEIEFKLDFVTSEHNDCIVCSETYKMYDHIMNIKYDESTGVGLVTFREIQNAGQHTCSPKCYSKAMKDSKLKYIVNESQYSDKTRLKLSEQVKERIRSGVFTPNVTNSWCRSRVYSKCGNFKFRSTWEAVFWSIIDDENLLYEDVRISYTIDGITRNYIVDFVNHKTKTIYEIKPDSEKKSDINDAKWLAAEAWCRENDYTFEIISDDWFNGNIDDLNSIHSKLDIEYDVLFSRMKQFMKSNNSPNFLN